MSAPEPGWGFEGPDPPRGGRGVPAGGQARAPAANVQSAVRFFEIKIRTGCRHGAGPGRMPHQRRPPGGLCRGRAAPAACAAREESRWSETRRSGSGAPVRRPCVPREGEAVPLRRRSGGLRALLLGFVKKRRSVRPSRRTPQVTPIGAPAASATHSPGCASPAPRAPAPGCGFPASRAAKKGPASCEPSPGRGVIAPLTQVLCRLWRVREMSGNGEGKDRFPSAGDIAEGGGAFRGPR